MQGTRGAGLAAAVVAATALAAVFAAEWWGGQVPCALCLWERWPYRVLIALGLLALVLPRQPARLVLAVAALVALGSAGLGAVHVGVEQGWWPSPLPECAAPSLGGGTVAERLARMPAQPAKPCDEPAYLIPGIPVSMALMNAGLSLVLAAGLVLSAARVPARNAAP